MEIDEMIMKIKRTKNNEYNSKDQSSMTYITYTNFYKTTVLSVVVVIG